MSNKSIIFSFLLYPFASAVTRSSAHKVNTRSERGDLYQIALWLFTCIFGSFRAPFSSFLLVLCLHGIKFLFGAFPLVACYFTSLALLSFSFSLVKAKHKLYIRIHARREGLHHCITCVPVSEMVKLLASSTMSILATRAGEEKMICLGGTFRSTHLPLSPCPLGHFSTLSPSSSSLSVTLPFGVDDRSRKWLEGCTSSSLPQASVSSHFHYWLPPHIHEREGHNGHKREKGRERILLSSFGTLRLLQMPALFSPNGPQ